MAQNHYQNHLKTAADKQEEGGQQCAFCEGGGGICVLFIICLEVCHHLHVAFLCGDRNSFKPCLR